MPRLFLISVPERLDDRRIGLWIEEMQLVERRSDLNLLSARQMHVWIHPGCEGQAIVVKIDKDFVSKELDDIYFDWNHRVRGRETVCARALNEVLWANTHGDRLA